jgi:hypothetical protein
MKKLLYSALIGSLALALTAHAADEKKVQKKAAPARGAVHAQRGPVRAGGPAQARMHANTGAMHVQRNAVNPGVSRPAVVHQNKVGRNRNAALRQAKVNQPAAQPNVARNEPNQAKIARGQHAAVNAQQAAPNRQPNAGGNRFANLKPNRHRQVALVNNWKGSRFSGQQYAAFRNYHRERHDRGWYHSHYPRIVLFGGGNYYYNNGYWFPAWGYDSGYNYNYDGPIYGYNDLNPDQVVVNVQTQLQQAGYYDGPIDGSIGPITRGAIAAFQADQGLAITSSIDEPTLSTLGLI